MPASVVVHAAFFAVGAALGAGVAAALVTSRREQPVSAAASAGSPIIQVQSSGRFGSGAFKIQSESPGDILRYGNPGLAVPVLSLATAHSTRSGQ